MLRRGLPWPRARARARDTPPDAFPPSPAGTSSPLMSTWKNVGMTYLKYADLCATHLRNALKEPTKTQAMGRSDMRARVMKWTDGKRGAPGARHDCRPRSQSCASAHARLPLWPAVWPGGGGGLFGGVVFFFRLAAGGRAARTPAAGSFHAPADISLRCVHALLVAASPSHAAVSARRGRSQRLSRRRR